MIADTLKNLNSYKGLSNNFKTAIAFILRQDLDRLTPKRFEIDGDKVYGFVVERSLEKKPKYWEAHRMYADIQLLLDGNERIGWRPLAGKEIPAFVYDDQKDIEFFEDLKGVDFDLSEGDFMIFLPQDMHLPDCPVFAGSHSRKLVVKVKIED
jgi:biofilm protein TabA